MGCHALLQGIFPTQGLNPHAFLISPALADRFFATSTTWEALIVILCNLDEFGAVSFPFFEGALALKKIIYLPHQVLAMPYRIFIFSHSVWDLVP